MVTVVCTGGDAPPPSLCLAWIDAAGLTVAADGGLALLRDLGRRAHLWVGDGDSLDGDLPEWAPWSAEFRVLDRAKDDSDTDAAVGEAIRRGQGEVWLIGGAGGRMDHWWANLRLVAREPALKRWLTAQEEGRTLGPGESLEVQPGVVSVFPLGVGPWNLASEGFRWPLDGVDFGRWHSLSNEVTAPGGRLVVSQGRFLVLRPHGQEAAG
jgi:thiamine pyrophosphokinase